jgi:hypothetical protein
MFTELSNSYFVGFEIHFPFHQCWQKLLTIPTVHLPVYGIVEKPVIIC